MRTRYYLVTPIALALTSTMASAQFYAPPMVYQYYVPSVAYQYYYAPPVRYYGPYIWYYSGDPRRRFWYRQERSSH